LREVKRDDPGSEAWRKRDSFDAGARREILIEAELVGE
jgi:hypothetical protein